MKSESLRDYWKRRAEESKAAADAIAGEGGYNNSQYTLGSQMSTKSSSGTTTTTSGNKNPPPPLSAKSRGRSEGVSSSSLTATTATTTAPAHRSSVHRSKSRGRDTNNVDNNTTLHVSGDGRITSSSSSSHSTQQQQQSIRRSSNLIPQQQQQQLKYERRESYPQGSSLDDIMDTNNNNVNVVHRCIANSNWQELYTHLLPMLKNIDNNNINDNDDHNNDNSISKLVTILSEVYHPTATTTINRSSSNNSNNNSSGGGTTVMHVLAWKAPSALVAIILQTILLVAVAKEESAVAAMKELLCLCDTEGNTPYHLCVANLTHRIGNNNEENEKRRLDKMQQQEGDNTDIICCLSGLEQMTKLIPATVWTIQNIQGDTPLHLLVSSPLCIYDWTILEQQQQLSKSSSGKGGSFNSSSSSSSSSSGLLEDDSTCTKLASTALSIVLASPGAIESCATQDSTGATPLHIALACGARDCVVEALLSVYPNAAHIEDKKGMIPLHWAAAFSKTGHAVIRKLVLAYPMGLMSPTTDGDIPLHLAVSNAIMEDESSIGGKIPMYIGDGVSSRREMNRLKIVELLLHDHTHYTAASGDGGGRRNATAANATTQDPLSTANEETTVSPILTTNREKLTPLHCCALFDAPPQISKLLMKHPDANAASSMTNSFGATPLHLAAAQPGVSQSIATVLAIGSPDAAAVQDRLKRTPLHVAAQNAYATNLLIKTLAELNPEAASIKTQRGHLPLHLAAQSQAKEAVVRALIKAYPAAAESRNKSNNTPLHDAAKYRASLGVVRLLLDAYPGALYVQNQYGNLPLHCATAYQAPSDVVQLLLKVRSNVCFRMVIDCPKCKLFLIPVCVLFLSSLCQHKIELARRSINAKSQPRRSTTLCRCVCHISQRRTSINRGSSRGRVVNE
jgi:ankyrin repeat protein